MNTVIEQMLRKYDSKNIYDQKNAMKEVMQEIVLYGLSRAGFFREAAFYGGTALRIFYGLDRFSEDLDFSLMTSNPNFDLKAYFPELEKTVRSFGLNVVISEKEKNKESAIRSAFLKGNTKEHFLLFYADEVTANSITKNEALKIKFEIDTMPPAFATFERRFCLAPMPYEINLYDEPSLFAGKIHAVLCRAWQNRVKGRDLYDYVFYIDREAFFGQRFRIAVAEQEILYSFDELTFCSEIASQTVGIQTFHHYTAFNIAAACPALTAGKGKLVFGADWLDLIHDFFIHFVPP